MKLTHGNINLPEPFFELDLLSSTDNYEKHSGVICSPMFTNSFYWDSTLNMWVADTRNVSTSTANYAAKCMSGDFTYNFGVEGFTYLMDIYLIYCPNNYRFLTDFIPRKGLNVYRGIEMNYVFSTNTWMKCANYWKPTSTYPFREIFIDGVSALTNQYSANYTGTSSGLGIQNCSGFYDQVQFGIKNIKLYKQALTADEIRQIQGL